MPLRASSHDIPLCDALYVAPSLPCPVGLPPPLLPLLLCTHHHHLHACIHACVCVQPPAVGNEFWLLMITWHVGLFTVLTLGQIGVQGRRQGYF